MSRRTAPVRPGDTIDVTIDRLAQGGRGVARHDGFVLFVQRGLPGDRVRARVTKVRRNHGEAAVEEVLEPGPSTITPRCQYVGTCGGCAWQGLDYAAQLEAKQASVIEALQRIAGIDEPPIEPIIGATDLYGYRNKVEYSFLELEDGTVGAGYHVAGRWDQLVHVDPCLIADPRGLPAHRVVLEWANRHGLQVYDREYADGYLRNLVVRVGHATGEVMVNIVTGPGALPKAAELVDDLRAEVPGLVSVLHARNSSSAEVAMGDDRPDVLWGTDHFHEQLHGATYEVRPYSFLQTNTQMSEQMYAQLREMADLRSDDVAYDLYCGIGTITLMLAEHVESVIGVEVVEEAIECARANAERNGFTNAEFQVGNVRPILKSAKGVWPEPSIIVVDPPRSGLVPKVVRRVSELRPERIMYVSCNPATFAADLPRFAEHGYQLVRVRAVDQFPHTHHVELVARLEPIPGWEPPTEDASDVAEGEAAAGG